MNSLSEKRLATFYGELGIGTYNNQTQIFRMLFDTGSSHFWYYI